MDTIFTLLIIILPIAFKLIGKKLEQAGQQPGSQQEPIEDWAEVLRRHMESQQQAFQQVEQKPAEVIPSASVTSSTASVENVKPVVKAQKPVLKEEPVKVGEKIDKKKLILYSEIMKPKYTE